MSDMQRGLDDVQLEKMDGDGQVRYFDPVSVPVGFYGQYPLRNHPDVSIREVMEDIPDADYRPWYRKDGG
jgi:hypothetical protein